MMKLLLLHQHLLVCTLLPVVYLSLLVILTLVTMTITSYEKILQLITDAHQSNKLDSSITVDISDMKLSNNPGDVIVTYSLGSCVPEYQVCFIPCGVRVHKCEVLAGC